VDHQTLPDGTTNMIMVLSKAHLVVSGAPFVTASFAGSSGSVPAYVYAKVHEHVGGYPALCIPRAS